MHKILEAIAVYIVSVWTFHICDVTTLISRHSAPIEERCSQASTLMYHGNWTLVYAWRLKFVVKSYSAVLSRACWSSALSNAVHYYTAHNRAVNYTVHYTAHYSDSHCTLHCCILHTKVQHTAHYSAVLCTLKYSTVHTTLLAWLPPDPAVEDWGSDHMMDQALPRPCAVCCVKCEVFSVQCAVCSV